jgi:hypothetical protein
VSLDTRCDRAYSDPARLRVADQPVDAALELKADFRELSRFAGAGLAANDGDLIGVDGTRNVGAPRNHRQFVGISRLRQIGEPLLRIEARSGHGRGAL